MNVLFIHVKIIAITKLSIFIKFISFFSILRVQQFLKQYFKIITLFDGQLAHLLFIYSFLLVHSCVKCFRKIIIKFEISVLFTILLYNDVLAFKNLYKDINYAYLKSFCFVHFFNIFIWERETHTERNPPIHWFISRLWPVSKARKSSTQGSLLGVRSSAV